MCLVLHLRCEINFCSKFLVLLWLIFIVSFLLIYKLSEVQISILTKILECHYNHLYFDSFSRKFLAK